MKTPDWKKCTEEELWKYVSSHLAANGVETVLVGGAVVSIYTEGAYRSGDLDLVLKTYFAKKLPQLMAEIGFSRDKSRHYSHPECQHLIVDFAVPPVGIGDDYQIVPKEIEEAGQKIYLYTPTDCIRDRLASYIHFKARECLDQAVMVAASHPFDLDKVRDWCLSENAKEQLEEFLRLISPKA